MLVCYFLSTFLSFTFICFPTSATPSFKKVSAFFGSFPYEEVLQKEYKIEKRGTIIIENIDGPITITTGWKKNTIFLKVIKKSNNPEQLPSIHIVDKQMTLDKLMIKTKYAQTKTKGLVEYELIVPTDIRLRISITNQGAINVKEIRGPISAITNQGNIEIIKTNNTIYAQITKTGSITVDQAQGAISATAHYGDITIDHSYQSILATTTKGHISVTCNRVPSTSSIRLETNSGLITLALPATTNASFKGKATHGTITSNHYLTLKPCTTKLNNMAWSRFKKEVDGIFGTGEAEIKCRSNHGNIKIIETVTA